MKLRTIGMAAVAALSLVAGRAEAQDAGWDTQYGILFTLPNLLQNGSSRVIDGYDGLVGFQYNLSPETAVRVSADLYRDQCGRTEATSTTNITTKTVCQTITGTYGGYNSELAVTLQAEYLMRMTTAAVSPYFGAGAGLSIDRKALKGTDESNAPGFLETEYKNSETEFGVGVGAKAGLEWRIHKTIALFAEYQAGLTLFQRTSFKVEETTTGSPTVKSDGNRLDYLLLETGVAQGGQLGLIAFF